MPFHVPNNLRVRGGPMGSDERFGNNGCFVLPHFNDKSALRFNVIAADGAGWEHVSVSLKGRCPTWEEMCWVKAIFWDETDWVLQFHPPESEYVNNHPYCLHLWRPIGAHFPTPPGLLVGLKDIGRIA